MKKIVVRPEDIIIVDGYVTLNNDGKIGLGGHLYEALEMKYPIVGVAKNEFTTPDSQRRSVFRGDSKTPLFVTARGIDIDEVKCMVEKMHGNYRIPTLLKKLDQLSRA